MGAVRPKGGQILPVTGESSATNIKSRPQGAFGRAQLRSFGRVTDIMAAGLAFQTFRIDEHPGGRSQVCHVGSCWRFSRPPGTRRRQRRCTCTTASVPCWNGPSPMEWRTDNACDRLLSVLGPSTMSSNTGRHCPIGRWRRPSKVCAADPAKVDALAFEFLVLTAARSGEVRGAV